MSCVLTKTTTVRRAPAAATIWSAGTSSGAACIEREAEIENDSGKVTGYEDQVKILSGGKRLAGALNKKHKKHDICPSATWRSSARARAGTPTTRVEWVDEKDVPLTKDEIKMVDESEIDLERYAYIAGLR